MRESYLFTSESVAAGHPDKLADQISDSILDAFLAREPRARVSCQTFVADDYAERHDRRAAAAEADLPADGGLRPFRPGGGGIHLGTYRSRGRVAACAWPVES